ncbi:nucleoid occlusion factor SlmA [Anaerotignum neopropionicum]|uniref:Nucleoid occlusion factor SlmA n=1 Tax=Anaerotignum neopropionicum TaxID=36847 RepID=A0A136WGB3_9FIRM|nr:TetR/AcrR family transcriptional regulator [Anaerotignum neopropionicum]KXL53443.1 nucleoid occlusion factor SlmA [Anaerotignum neopropionicum]
MQVLKDEVRLQILQVAEKLFCEKGFLETTTRGIAKEVGISVSNLYLYYENKEMLFNAVADPIFHEFVTGFQKLMTHEDQTEELNQNISFVIGKMIAVSKGKFLLIFEKSKGTRYEGFREEIIALVQKHVMEQMNDKVDDKALMSKIFAQNLIEGIIAVVKAHGSEEELQQNLQHLTNFYAKGIRQFLK